MSPWTVEPGPITSNCDRASCARTRRKAEAVAILKANRCMISPPLDRRPACPSSSDVAGQTVALEKPMDREPTCPVGCGRSLRGWIQAGALDARRGDDLFSE